MLVTDYLSKEFDGPQINQKIEEVLPILDEFKLTHLPVFDANHFCGNLTEESLKSLEPGMILKDAKHTVDHFYLTENSHIFDAIGIMYAQNANVIPVFNNEENYMGYLMWDDILAMLSKMPFVSEIGAFLVVEIPQRQYSLSEIAKIVESNNNRLFGAIVLQFVRDKVQVLIKLNSENLSSVTETFERFGYTIIHRFFTDEKQELLKERFDLLQRYLNI